MNDAEGDNDHPDNKKLAHEGWESLKDKKRSCTDTVCIVRKLIKDIPIHFFHYIRIYIYS